MITNAPAIQTPYIPKGFRSVMFHATKAKMKPQRTDSIVPIIQKPAFVICRQSRIPKAAIPIIMVSTALTCSSPYAVNPATMPRAMLSKIIICFRKRPMMKNAKPTATPISYPKPAATIIPINTSSLLEYYTMIVNRFE